MITITKDSKRTEDPEFGYLTVEDCVLTGDDVAQYYGREVPNFKELGLDPKKIYYVYRPLGEIKNSDFTNKPLLSTHADFSSDDYKNKLIVGTIGETGMKGEQLRGTVVFWDKKAIDELEKGKKYLSCGYSYKPILETGFCKNIRYDIKMTEIVANHVAMVDNPRYKPAIVADNETVNNNKEIFSMFFNKKKPVLALDANWTFDSAMKEIKAIIVGDEEESEKEKKLEKVKEKMEKYAGKDKKMSKDEEEKKKMKAEAEDEEEEMAEDEEVEEKEQKEEEKKEAASKDKKAKDTKMAKDEAIKKLVSDSVSIEMEKFRKKTIAFDSAIKEYERVCGRVNKLAFDNAESILETILKNNKKTFENKSFEQKQAMVEMLPNTKSFQPTTRLTLDSSSTKSHLPENVLNFLKKGA